MVNVKNIADEAGMIINGYSFKCSPEGFRVLNLNCPDKAVVLSKDGEVLETSMDDIEIQIVKDYLEKNRKFLEEYNAKVLRIQDCRILSVFHVVLRD